MSNTKPLDLSRFEGHTPGPWFDAEKNAIHDQAVVWPENDGGAVAVCYASKNAPLIAAAPDLLAEVVRLRLEIEQLRWHLETVAAWHKRAEDEKQQSGPILRDYLAHAGKSAKEALAEQEGNA